MKHIITFFSVLFATFVTASALQITEIMYYPPDDADNEWIEVYNNSGSDVDLTKYRVINNTVNHDIKSYQGGAILMDNSYAIIAKSTSTFMSKYEFAGQIFSSAISLNNSGATITLQEKASANSVFISRFDSINSSNGKGGSLNLVDGEWKSFMPSLGEDSPQVLVVGDVSDANDNDNDDNSNTNTGGSGSGSNNSNSSNSSTKKEIVYVSKSSYSLGDLSILMPQEMDTIAGQNTSFVLQVTNKAKLPTNVYWSYGDGAEGSGASSTHRYKWSGTYTAFVEADTSTAYGIDSMRVTVHHPDLTIAEVYSDVSSAATRESNDSYIVIQNNGAVDLDIGGFIIATDQGFFPLSRHLLLPAKKSIKLAGETLGFLKANNVRLLFNNKMLVTKFTELPIVTTPSVMQNTINTDTSAISATSVIASPALVPALEVPNISVSVTPLKQIETISRPTVVSSQSTKLKTFTAQVVVPGTTPSKQSQKIAINLPKISDTQDEASARFLEVSVDKKEESNKETKSFWDNIFYWLYN